MIRVSGQNQAQHDLPPTESHCQPGNRHAVADVQDLPLRLQRSNNSLSRRQNPIQPGIDSKVLAPDNNSVSRIEFNDGSFPCTNDARDHSGCWQTTR